jgi:hypothetical protein
MTELPNTNIQSFGEMKDSSEMRKLVLPPIEGLLGAT